MHNQMSIAPAWTVPGPPPVLPESGATGPQPGGMDILSGWPTEALPQGFEAQIRPRSGLAIKKGITVLNSPGTIDADYRGEICIILVNLSSETFVIEDGERIAQMVIAKHEQAVWQEVEVLDETERGAGGFGHTGKK